MVKRFCVGLMAKEMQPVHERLGTSRGSHQSEKSSRSRKHNRHWITQDRCGELESWFGCGCAYLMKCHATGFPALFLWNSQVGWKEEWNTSITKSQRSRAGTPSMRKPASSEIISDSALLSETAVCFLHIHEMGTNVCDPNTHSEPPDVDFASRKSPVCNVQFLISHTTQLPRVSGLVGK